MSICDSAIPASVAWVTAGVLVGVPTLALPVAVPLWVGAIALSRRLPIVALCCVAGALLASLVAVGSVQRTPADLREASESARHITAAVSVTAPAEGDRVRVSAEGVPMLLFGEVASTVRIGTTLEVAGTIQMTDAGDREAFLFFADCD